MKYAWIDAHKATWPVALMCKVLAVSKSGYYAHKHRASSPVKAQRAEATSALCTAITAQQTRHKDRYGRMRMTAQLRQMGMAVNHKRVGKCMKQLGLQCKLRRKHKICTTDSKHGYGVAPNVLDRQFTQEAPNKAWAADITYIPTGEGWVFAALVLDLFSKKIVGWALDAQMPQGLTQEALRTALLRRQPAAGLIHHSDRGSQYAAHGYREILSSCGMTVSMSRKGNCWDNAAMESANGTLKVECVNRKKYATRQAAKQDVLEFIGYYNHERLHSALKYQTPAQFERNWQEAQSCAKAHANAANQIQESEVTTL